MCRMMDVTVEPVDPASLPEPSSHGAKILQGKCTQCHGLVSPKRHGKEDWRHIVDRMDRRMRMMGRHGMGMRGAAIKSLDLEEKSILLAYLQKYALKALRGPDVPLAESPGAKKFSSVCSQCHVLPDPASHLTEEWPAVVERMAQYMFNMGFGELNAADKKAIVSYLQSQTSN
ncbi:hypothetical protein A7E78_04555 [Syntrophotalea acetylenivorans]|uniref:Cytochrome c domain-containing protein n=2 Tax=Syntrophotalea acetylenivorans TaxID=1842532 RepID=A0A1L3GMK6_9BACT|nr:hypothetical protein A7E78_04555 [Syntrophotalea acetylenivorans]